MADNNFYNLVWRATAIEHLQKLLDDVSQHDARAALKYADDIEHRIGNLSVQPGTLRHHPFVGTVYDENYRMLVVRNYLVFYRVEEEGCEVIVVHVIYGGRDIEAVIGLRK